MSWGPLLVNLAVTAGLVAVLMLATFAYAMRTRVHAIMDTIWPLGFVLIALVSFVLSAGSGVAGRRTCCWQTGKRLLEKHMARSKGAEYADYVRRTSGFIPLAAGAIMPPRHSGTPFRCQFQTGARPGSAARTATSSRSWPGGSGGSRPSGTRNARFPPSSTENALSRSVAVRMPTRLRCSRA